MGFLQPLALLALPLALLPLLLARQRRRRGTPIRFSSLHLFEEARRRPAPRRKSRSRRVLLLRVIAIALLVLAAARPVGPGRGPPGAHRPTRLVVAVDISASTAQRSEGRQAWSSIQAWADSVLALATSDDRVSLAAVADGIVGWWAGRPETLRRRLAALEPTARGSDWPRSLAALEARLEDGTEAYLLTDGAVGARAPQGREGPAAPVRGHRALRVWEPAPAANRALAEGRWVGPDRVALTGRAWNASPEPVIVGRLRGEALADTATIPLDGTPGAATWWVGDSATFALGGDDRLQADDRLYVARGSAGAYRVIRLAAPEDPPESGGLFWEAALGSTGRGAIAEEVRSLDELAGRGAELAVLPIRRYRSDEAEVLAGLAARGTRLLFAPQCSDPACVPAGEWLPAPGPATPVLRWRLGEPGRRTALSGRPGIDAPLGVPEHLLARTPVRGALGVVGGARPDWTWDLVTGEPGLWVRGLVAVWLVALGPPVTRLGTTPVFPLVADAALAAWDPRWRGTGALRPGDPAPVVAEGAIVTGPLHRTDRTTWSVPAGGAAPRLERAGLYRVEAEGTTFVAVNGDPAEGNLAPIASATWEASWGTPPASAEEWERALFPRRRGPELWPWAVVLALAGLVAQARLARVGLDK